MRRETGSTILLLALGIGWVGAIGYFVSSYRPGEALYGMRYFTVFKQLAEQNRNGGRNRYNGDRNAGGAAVDRTP